MPEKSIRDMNKYERLHYSLASRTFRATLKGAILLGVVALLLGLGLYAYALAGRYISDAFNLSRHAAAIVDKVGDPAALSDRVMAIYRGLTEEQRQQVGTDAYRARFAALDDTEDYQSVRSVLKDLLSASDVYDVYVAVYDPATSAIVYVVDPEEDEEFVCLPGDWEPVEQTEIEKFYNWDGEGMLYDVGNTDKYGWLCTSGVPIRGADGRIAGFLLADVTLGNIVDGMKAFLLQYTIAMFIAVNLLGFLMTRRMKKTLVVPINKIAQAAEAYIHDRKDGDTAATHFQNLNITTGDEIENLALIMADMENDLRDYEEHLTKVTAEKERIGLELALATRIQADMLPNIYPAFPDRSDFDIYATMTPAKEVGGDFYDFFLIDDDHLGLVMADVSGKGVPAALFMMVSKILIKNYAMTGRSPREVLEAVNEQICSNNREEMFVTVWFGVLDLQSGTLTAANAGHEYPVLKRPDGNFELVRDKHGFVIGGMAGLKYKEYTLQMDPGAKLFLYTDGVAEATNADNALFGVERMVDALNSKADGSPYDLLGAVNDAVDVFVADAPQFDDLTMLCVHYIGKGRRRMKELTIEATVANIERVTEFVNAELEALDCPMKAQMQIDVAIDELFGNIAQYAYNPETGPATVRVEVEDDPMSVIITFIDNGKPFDPLKKADPDTTLSAEEREIGGLGVFLVKKTMDDVSYEYKNGQNILKIKKHI